MFAVEISFDEDVLPDISWLMSTAQVLLEAACLKDSLGIAGQGIGQSRTPFQCSGATQDQLLVQGSGIEA